ncbi:MAG: hypothetical protein EOO38_07245 [Cytophagaceae bacterium]|nr:MAG: hypothetical protein EOO38_07245 [Cytophagaceae bacterium]
MDLSPTVVDFNVYRRAREAQEILKGTVGTFERPLQPVDWYLSGTTGKSRVSTAFGDVPIEVLRRKDAVRTYFGATAEVQVVDQIHLDQDFLRRAPGALPIKIPANSIAPGKPANDLFISPGQEISLDLHVAKSFTHAKDLSSRFRMDLSYSVGLTYVRFHCGSPVVVKIDNIWFRINPWEKF